MLPPRFDNLVYGEDRSAQKTSVYFISVKGKKQGVVKGKLEIIPAIYDGIKMEDQYIRCVKTAPKPEIWLYTMGGKKLATYSFANVDCIANENNNEHVQLFIGKAANGKYSLGYIDYKNSKLVLLMKDAHFIETVYSTNLLVYQKDSTAAQQQFRVIQPGPGVYEVSYDTERKQVTSGSSSKSKTVTSPGESGFPEPPPGGFEFKKVDGTWKYFSNYKLDKTLTIELVYDTVYQAFSSYDGFEFREGNQSKKYENILVAKKNGLFGLLFPDGKKIEPAFDGVKLFQYNRHSVFLRTETPQIFFEVRKGAKVGVINQNGEYVLPAKFDTITSNLIVKENGKFGIMSLNKRPLYPVVCDSIYFSKVKYYLESNNQYGMVTYSYYQDSVVQINCISPYRIREYKEFFIRYPKSISYVVFEVVDSNNNFIGYFDQKGFAYFK